MQFYNFVKQRCHPQNIALAKTRGEALGMEIIVGKAETSVSELANGFCGAMIQYPDTYGGVHDWTSFVNAAHEKDVLIVACTDLMASVVCKSVAEQGFDIAVGSAQRFGVPMGFGGPHAAFLATTDAYSRKMPGRIIGVSVDSRGKPALRMAMQTREQHIRRDKATSNICTAQALLANMAAFYAVYHGPDGLTKIAERIHGMAAATAETLTSAGFVVDKTPFFDTIKVDVSKKGLTGPAVQKAAAAAGVNLRVIDNNTVGMSFGEAITRDDVEKLVSAFGVNGKSLSGVVKGKFLPDGLKRNTPFLTHPVFNTYRSESQMLRYLKHLETKDLSLNYSVLFSIFQYYASITFNTHCTNLIKYSIYSVLVQHRFIFSSLRTHL